MSSTKNTTVTGAAEGPSQTMRDVADEALRRRAAAEAGGAIPPTPGAPGGAAPGVPTEAEQAAIEEAAALAQAMDDWNAEAAMVDEAIAVSLEEAMTFKSFVPTVEFPALQTLGKPAGWKLEVGRIRGIINRTERITTPYGGSIALLGLFLGVSHVPEMVGKVLNTRRLFLNRVSSESIDNSLTSARRQDPRAVIRLDIEIGLRALGKPQMPYTWTTDHYLTGAATRAIRELQAPRRLTGAGQHRPAISQDGTTAADGTPAANVAAARRDYRAVHVRRIDKMSGGETGA